MVICNAPDAFLVEHIGYGQALPKDAVLENHELVEKPGKYPVLQEHVDE